MFVLTQALLAYPSAKEWRGRRVYQIMTDRFASLKEGPCTDLHSYCGGTYQALIKKLDYIKSLGYNAIWISPTVEQSENSSKSYHGYWFANFYASNPWFGTDQDLRDFIAAAHKKDIWVMADVVYNHVGNCNNDLYNYSCIKTFPLAEYYHPNCEITDYSNVSQVMNCRLCGLPDLDQNNAFVNQTLLHWAEWYQKEYGFDGYRVDTVKHIDHRFWQDLRKITPWYNIAEIFDGSYDFIQSFTNSKELYTAFNYPLYFTLSNSIGGGQSMANLGNNFREAATKFGDGVRDMGIFMENHDNPRFLTNWNDLRKYENALTLIHTWIGIPYLYYGSEQDMKGGADPDNRHALWTLGYSQTAHHYPFIQTLNKLRAKFDFATLDQHEYKATNDFYAYGRGNILVTLTNKGKGGAQVHYKVETAFPANAMVCNIFWPNDDCVNVNSDGTLDVYLNDGEAKVFVRQVDLP